MVHALSTLLGGNARLGALAGVLIATMLCVLCAEPAFGRTGAEEEAIERDQEPSSLAVFNVDSTGDGDYGVAAAQSLPGVRLAALNTRGRPSDNALRRSAEILRPFGRGPPRLA